MNTTRRVTGSLISALAVLAVGVVLPLQAQAMPPALAARHHTGHTHQANVARVVIKNFAFHPASLTIKHETTVVWINQDSVAHTVTANDGSFDSGAIAPGKIFRHTFLTEGVTVRYHCTIHPSMMGRVIVQE